MIVGSTIFKAGGNCQPAGRCGDFVYLFAVFIYYLGLLWFYIHTGCCDYGLLCLLFAVLWIQLVCCDYPVCFN